MVKNNIDALRSVYLSLGGSLDDTYEDINGGSPVSAYRSVKDHIAAISKLVEMSLPSSIFDVTQTLDFSNLETTATVAGNSFTKISTTSLTAEQLNGAIFRANGDEMAVTSDMLSDMSGVGVTGTSINIPDFGPIMFSCTEAGSVVSEPGCYLVTQMLPFVNSITLSYQGTCEAMVRAIAMGTAELTDNTSSLPDGVIYLQIEG